MLIFKTLNVPVSSFAPGTSSDLGALGPNRSFVIDGVFDGSIVLEGSNDGVNFAAIPGVRFDSDGVKKIVDANGCRFVRVRRISSSTAAIPVLTVGAELTSNVFSSALDVPAVDGSGAALDTSSGGDFLTIVAEGLTGDPSVDGIFTIEASQDGGVTFAPIAGFNRSGSKVISLICSADFVRVALSRASSNSGSVNIAVSATNSKPPELPVASWSSALCRYFFIDNENGDDSNLGYIDDAPGTVFTAAQTSPIALKTSEELRNRLPRTGSDRIAVCLFKPRAAGGATYLNKASAADFLDINYPGYEYIAFRVSDLTNDANDLVDLGGIQAAAGPNGDGSWTVDSRSGFAVTVSAGVLPVRDTLAGSKLEFKGNVTASIRTRGNVVADRTADTIFDLGSNIAAGFVPEAGDEFFFRRPGVIFSGIFGQPYNGKQNTLSTPSTIVAGFEFTDLVTAVYVSPVAHVFIRFNGTVNLQGGLNTAITYLSESGGFPFTSCGMDFRGSVVMSGSGWGLTGATPFALVYSAFHGATTLLNLGPRATMGGGCYFDLAPLIQFTVSGRRSSAGEGGVILGTESSSQRRARAIAGFTLRGFAGTVRGIDVDGSVKGLDIRGEGNDISIVDAVGVTTGAFIDLSSEACAQSRIYIGAGVTGSGTPDILLIGAISKTLASLAGDHWIDGGGNLIQGTAGLSVRRITDGTMFNVPVLAADPAAPVNGDTWLKDTGGVRTLHARIGGVTYSVTLT